MLSKLLSILPTDLTTTTALAAGAAGLLVGAALWLTGARFSRSITTLAGVAAGTWLGMHLPAWLGWGVDGTGPAVVGAVALGVVGYLFHTTAVGVFLGSALGLAACGVAWMVLAGDAQWTFPAVDWSAESTAILAAVWRSMPGELPKVMPVALAGGLTAGVILTVLWPKAARALTYSLLGVGSMAAGGFLAVHAARPQWVEVLPGDPAVQAFVLGLLVAVGAALQWAMLPKAAVAGVKPGVKSGASKPARATSPVSRPKAPPVVVANRPPAPVAAVAAAAAGTTV